MIDPHVHLRDGEQQHKETIRHGLAVAEVIGLTGVFDMPNTSPPILRREHILRRLDCADRAESPVFYGLYCGLTSDPKQISEAVSCTREFDQVVGLKLFAGKSTGDLSIPDTKSQSAVFRTLAEEKYTGVLAIHCENEADFKPELWNPEKPITHTLARPPKAEVNSIEKMISLANSAGFNGILHVCHISLPESVEALEKARNEVKFRITCGITPHHLLLYDTMMNQKDGILLKMNPPLRSKNARDKLMQMLLEERIDWIETDHAPHRKIEKMEPPFASGIPGFPIIPRLLKRLREKGATQTLLERITHQNICDVYGITIPNRSINDVDTFDEYEFNAYKNT
ncbi:MAG: dihydroorotase [Candidatus Neomarinimicrobiota bacterium]|nr:MAG: dihydroorotase [Candidatus Neomarinimicrobiota bacterium]